jgi:hypothetical protein
MTIKEIFMPEGLCATCGVNPVVYEFDSKAFTEEEIPVFRLAVHYSDEPPSEAVILGFCSEACLCKWKAGNEALRRAV